MKSTSLLRLFWLLLYLYPFFGYVVPSNIHYLTNNEGLSNSSINVIFQDSNDLMWFGTWDGLNLYNSREFTIFKPDPDLEQCISNNIIRDIIETEGSKLWIATDNGINLYQGGEKNFKTYFYDYQQNTVFKEHSFLICKNQDNEVFSAVYKMGIYYYDEKLDDFIPLKGIRQVALINLFCDHIGRMWIHTEEKEVYQIELQNNNDRPTVKKIDAPELSIQPEKLFFNEKENQIWAQDKEGSLYRYEEASRDFIKQINFDKRLTHIIFENTSYTLGTLNGLYKLDLTQMEISPILEEIPVFSLYKGSQDILWIGTDGQGIITLTPRKEIFESFSLKSSSIYGLSAIRAFHTTEDDKLLIGTKGAGMYLFQNNKSQEPAYRFTTENGLISNSIYTLSGKINDICWIGTDGQGLNYWDNKTNRVYKLEMEERLNIMAVYTLYPENDTTLWVGTNGFGLSKLIIDRTQTPYKVKSSQKYIFQEGEKEGLSSNVVFAIIPDEEGNLWIGTRGGGLNCLNKDSGVFTHYRYIDKEENTLSNNDILCLYKSHNNHLWIGTSHGLNSLNLSERNTSHFKRYTEKEGIPNNTIHGIQEDENGNIWVSTNHGLARLNSHTGEITSYYQNDGLQNNEFSDGAAYKSPYTGELYFGGINGYNKFHPANIKDNLFTPRLNFDAFLVNNKNVDINNYKREKHGKNTLMLTYREKLLGFKFTPIDYVSRAKCEMSYKLEPQAKEWIQMGTSQLIVFNDLSYGNHILKIKYSNANKIWSEEIYEIPIHISPPWWLSKTAYFIYFIITLILFFIIYKVAKNKIKMEHILRLRNLEKKKTEEIHQAKLRFFTNIAHEFSNSLTLICTPSQQLLQLKHNDPQVKKYVRNIQSNANRMQGLIQELMEFRKAETGFLELHPEQLDIKEVINYTSDYFINIADQKKIAFTIDLRIDNPYWHTDRSCLEKILFNIISNAFKYTPEKGYIHISAKKQEREFIFQVKNSGKGIKEEDLKLIFNRFSILDRFETQIMKGETRTGIGLALCQTLTNLLGGTIEVESVINEYTNFTLCFPVTDPIEQSDSIPSPLPSDKQYMENALEELDIENQPKSEFTIEEEKTEKQYTILIVEDENEIKKVLYELLKEEFNLKFADNGKEGLAILRNTSVDLIISDIIMPEMDGVTFVSEIKKEEILANIPVLFLSSRNSIDSHIEGLEVGADAYMGKPFNVKLLQTTIQRLLNSRKGLKTYFDSPLSAIENFEGKSIHREDKEFITKLTKIVSDNIDNENLSIDMLSQQMAISKMKLYRKLKEIKGETPTEFIRKIRMTQVEKMLKTTQKTIQEIMFDCGFNNKAYFYQEFTRQFKVTPGEYRKEHGKKNGNE